MVDGPSPEHEWVWRGRLAGQAPDIDPVVYLTDARPRRFLARAVVDVEIVGAASLRSGGSPASPPADST